MRVKEFEMALKNARDKYSDKVRIIENERIELQAELYSKSRDEKWTKKKFKNLSHLLYLKYEKMLLEERTRFAEEEEMLRKRYEL